MIIVLPIDAQEPSTVAATWKGYGVKVQRYPVPPIRAGRRMTPSYRTTYN